MLTRLITTTYLLVLVLESEVQRLGREVTDDVGQVTAPVCGDALFLRDADEAIDHAYCQWAKGDRKSCIN